MSKHEWESRLVEYAISTVANEGSQQLCMACNTDKMKDDASVADGWKCENCTYVNSAVSYACGICSCSLLVQNGGWMCTRCVPSQPVEAGHDACEFGHREDDGHKKLRRTTVPKPAQPLLSDPDASEAIREWKALGHL